LISSSGSKNSLKEVAKALNDGHTVALFPEGMLTRNGGMNTFCWTIIASTNVPIIILHNCYTYLHLHVFEYQWCQSHMFRMFRKPVSVLDEKSNKTIM
jgi:1-acyl-sn-glycerol-3-phosphate acyltransferase